MYKRSTEPVLHELLQQFPAVVLLGPRQVGKTTLALAEGQAHAGSLYLDLELPSAQRQLDDPEAFLLTHRNRLVILDEVQRLPEIFAVLRAIIDIRIRSGEPSGQFLLLGSATGVLLQQSSESLAGRMVQLELSPLQAREIMAAADPLAQPLHMLWIRGGFPLSWLAKNDSESFRWREAFIASYLERDIPALGPRIPATSLRRLWTMLAHLQGSLLNYSQLATALAISGQLVHRYVDILCDLMLLRRLAAWHGNVGKRLVKSPKVYVRDSGLVHALLGLTNYESVLSHPVAGLSWEGFVIEQIMSAAPSLDYSFYRTAQGAEADLVIDFRHGQVWVVEIKRSSAPTVSKGFHQAALDVNAHRKILVAPVEHTYQMKDNIEVMSVQTLIAELVG
ncbi:MAG: ATP-binding protein [Zwartia sp.]